MSTPYRYTAWNASRIVASLMLMFMTLPLLSMLFNRLAFAANFTPRPASPNPLAQLTDLCGFVFLVSGLVAIEGYGLYSGINPSEARLTEDAFYYGRHGRVRTIRLDEIISVTDDYSHAKIFGGKWTIILTDVHGQRLRLKADEFGFPRWFDSFNYQAILRDLLPRLPASAQIAPGIQAFVKLRNL